MKVFVLSMMLLAVAMAAPGIMNNEVNSELSSFDNIAKIIGNCADTGDVTTCLTIKGITALNRAARSPSLEIVPGIATFNRDPNAPSMARMAKSLSENEIISSLPVDAKEKRGRLFDLLMDSATNFLSSHDLNVKIPKETTEVVARAIEEGRGKLKKIVGPVVLAVGAKLIALIPIFLGGLVLLATKALVVAKIAFILAAILGFQKLGGGGSGFNLLSKFSGAGGAGGQGWSSPQQTWSSGNSGVAQGWSSGGSASYPYARSYDEIDNAATSAQNKAYSAQIPETIESEQSL